MNNNFSFLTLLKRFLFNLTLIFTKYFKTYTIWVLDDDSKFSVLYDNKTTQDKDCMLFGYNDYQGKTNYGNDKDVEIYIHNINRNGIIEAGVLKLGLFRIQFPEKDRDYICGSSFKLNFSDANGKKGHRFFAPVVSIDIYQQQNDIIDMSNQFVNTVIDANTFITFKLKSNSHITFTIQGKKAITVDYWDYKKHILSDFAKRSGGIMVMQIIGGTGLKVRNMIIKKIRHQIKSLLGL